MPVPRDDERPTPPPDLGVLADAERIATVRRLIAAGPVPPAVDRLTQTAARLLGTPAAQVSLLTEEQIVASIVPDTMPRESRRGALEHSLCSVTAASGRPLIVDDAPRHPWVAHLPPVTSGNVGAYLSVPLMDQAGHLLGAFCVYGPDPRPWRTEDVTTLRALGDLVAAELLDAARASMSITREVQLGLTLAAADMGTFAWDLASGELRWDDRLMQLFGYEAEDFVPDISSFDARCHPDDRGRVQAEIDRAIGGLAEFASEYRVVRPDGTQRWVQARGRVLPDMLGQPARFLGVAYDSTELREARAQLARVLETMSDAFFRLDREWRFTYLNAEAERLLERSREELLERNVWDEYPDAVGSSFQREYERAVATGQPVSLEEYYPPLDRWFEVLAWPDPSGLNVYFHDINDRKRAEYEREAAMAEVASANHRLAALAEAASQLSLSLEPKEVLETLAALVVPALGDWVVVALSAECAAPIIGGPILDSDSVQIVLLRHRDATKEDALRDLLTALPLRIGDAHGAGAVIAQGRTEYLPAVTDDVYVAIAKDEQMLARLRTLEVGAALTVPLTSRGRQLGAMSVAEPSERASDRELIESLASRAAVALDNALLYGQERSIALTLQASLLPDDTPVIPGVELATRYIPSSEGALAGGDFYQAVHHEGGVLLALGDVMGHGIQSAARMGQLRAIVATLALEGHCPAELLDRLARDAQELLDVQLATLLVCVYDPVTGRLTYASAGHPPPLLVPPGGPARFCEVEPGPPIGLGRTTYEEAAVDVPPGSALVLFSDGLIESRDEPLGLGLQRLATAANDAPHGVDDLAEHLLEVMDRREGGDDDIAMLVMRTSTRPA